MSEFKVGDKVVLRPETKPYTFLNCYGNISSSGDIVYDNKTYIVLGIKSDGNITIKDKDDYMQVTCLCKHHLKNIEEKVNQPKPIPIQMLVKCKK